MKPDLTKAIKMAQRDPVFFVREVLGGDPWEKQEEILRAICKHRRVAVRSGHGVGKTKVAAWAVIWFLFCHKNSKVITTAPTWHQIENLLWREIRQTHESSKIGLGGTVLLTRLEIDKQWFALGLSTDESERFQGYHAENILLVIDEASGVGQHIYDAAEGILTTSGARLLLIGNPTRLLGEFYNAFHSPLYHKIHISVMESPNIVTENGKPRPYLATKEWVEERKIQWGEGSPLWLSRVIGEFPEQNDDTLIPLALIEEAQNRYEQCQEGGPVELGVDIARYGTNKSIIVLRKGIKAKIVAEMQGQNTMAVAGEIVDAIRTYSPEKVKIDVVGIGAGVVDRLKEQGYTHIYEMGAGEAANDKERYANLRAEWHWALRERFYSGDIAIEADNELEAQLSNIKYRFDSRGRIIIESKEEAQKRKIPSPDKADALILAFARTAKESLPEVTKKLFRRASLYD